MVRKDDLKLISIVTAIIMIFLMLLFSSCGRHHKPGPSIPADANESTVSDNGIVKSRATVFVSTPDHISYFNRMLNKIFPVAFAASGTAPVVVTNTISTTMTLSTVNLVIPAISDVLLDFGTIAVSGLQDNNLKLCGTNGHTKCTHAAFRMYTTGNALAGFYNSDGYSEPITASFNNQTQTLGLLANPVIMQQITIANNRNTVKLSDFSPLPVYGIQSDFTDAGVGSFSTTLVIEYVLLP